MAGGVADLFAVRRLRLTLVSSPRNLGAAKSLTRFGGLARPQIRKTASRRSLTDGRCARFVNYIAGIMSFLKFFATISAFDGEPHGGEPPESASGAYAGPHRQLQCGWLGKKHIESQTAAKFRNESGRGSFKSYLSSSRPYQGRR